MIDKKRRDITLGEMQDECSKRSGLCSDGMPTQCQYSKICDSMLKRIETENGDYAHNEWRSPIDWNLTDPPRFNEAQMEALQASYASGVTKISKTKYALHFVIPSIMSEIVVGNIGLTEILEVGETLDLAELLRKDAT